MLYCSTIGAGTNFMRYHLLAAAVLLSAGGYAQDHGTPASPAAGVTTCRAINRGVEYRTYFPDGRRYVYVSAVTLRGMQPSVLIIIDKNYVSPPGPKPKPADQDTIAWWIDRTQPFSFSTDNIRATYEKQFSIGSMVNSVFSSSPPTAFTVPIGDLDPAGSHFEGTGNEDPNTYAFQLRVDYPLNTADKFDITLPTVSFEGVTVTTPPLHFTRNGDDPLESDIKC